jgi:hypothetical protein
METMASRLTPLGFFVKWIFVPLSLGAVGYFLVGPRVESEVPQLKEQMQKATGGEQPEAEPNDEEKPVTVPAHNFSEPQVDVTVTALNTRERPKKEKRRRRAKPPAEKTTPSSEPSVSPPAVGPGDGGGDPGVSGL